MLPPKLIYKLILFLALVFYFLALAVPVFGSIVDRVVAKVNNEIITLSSVKSRVALNLSRVDPSDSNGIKQTEKQLMQQALDNIIDDKLQIQEGKKIGLVVTDEILDNAIADIYKNNNITAKQFKLMLEKEGSDFMSYKKIIHDQILSSRVVKMHLRSSPLSSNRDALKYYKNNKKKYWVPSKVMVSQIMFINEKDSLQSDVELKIIKAQEVLDLLRAGNDFSDLAKKYSEDVTGSLGGRVGIIERGTTLPKFEEIAFNLKLNEVSNVFQTENGIHIIRCDDIISGYFKSYKDVKSEIKGLLDFKKNDENYIAWMRELRKSAFIEVKLFEKPRNRRKTNNLPIRLKTKPARLDVNQKSIEAKLRYLKKLRDNEKISNQKYLEKKKKILSEF
jgi:parvulin-like peptidyl-prolyl isomerase